MDYDPLQSMLLEAVQLTRSLSAVHRRIAIDGLPWESVMILRYVLLNGPATVSALARRHKVSRQYMAAVVEEFSKHGHVSLADNPKHKRSKLVVLTDQGRDVVQRTDECGRRTCQRLGRYFEADHLRAITETLKRLRGIIDGQADVRQVDVNPSAGLAAPEEVG